MNIFNSDKSDDDDDDDDHVVDDKNNHGDEDDEDENYDHSVKFIDVYDKMQETLQNVEAAAVLNAKKYKDPITTMQTKLNAQIDMRAVSVFTLQISSRIVFLGIKNYISKITDFCQYQHHKCLLCSSRFYKLERDSKLVNTI